MTGVRQKLKAAPPEVRSLVLALLDEISQPMARREIEEALRPSGMTRGDRRRAAQALKDLPIIAISPQVGGWRPLETDARL